MTFSRSIEDYIKAIYELHGTDARVSSTALADKLGVTPASVTGMVKRIAHERPDVIDYTPHHGVLLTTEGRSDRAADRAQASPRGALSVHGRSATPGTRSTRRPRGSSTSFPSKLEERMASYLGHPSVDPHGDPIPTSEGTVATPGPPAR